MSTAAGSPLNFSEAAPQPMSSGSETPLKRIPFTKENEERIGWLATWMMIAAGLEILGGVANAINTFVPKLDFSHAISAVLSIVIGVWLFQAATAFKKVVTTDTADQQFLVEGFSKLRLVFLLKSVLILIMLAFVCAMVLIVLAVALIQGLNR
jgi:hypothetical protein